MAVNPDLHLWRSVLHVGLTDAARGKDADWLGSSDFEAVCNLAGVNAEAVMRCYSVERFGAPRRRQARAA
jgi:hypothetical protein